ncbi:hypothetical protein KP509_17G073000 [Ceratopteris richardii]|uniref:Response regulatory domain-containing protein n=1 Tax=Ceratopteris richardii TaxID=49495 RepID=A0A8T2SZC5_CERRI|nr:hypothetical protein KP509_17G073000 [Ceratopteris richardii]
MVSKEHLKSDIPGPASTTPPEVQPSEVHVLAVDDSLIDRTFIERLLKTSSYKVTAVDSGIRALEILGIAEALGPVNLNAFQVNLIITDYCMPGMTGYDLLKKIKGISALKEIPVVIMSSENVPNRISSCLAEGAKEFLLKPVQLADVKRLRGHVCHHEQKQDGIYKQEGVCLKRQAPADEVQMPTGKRFCSTK